MKSENILYAMGQIDDKLIYNALHEKRSNRKLVWIKRLSCAACICIIFNLSMTLMTDKIPAFYNILYSITPSTAQFFKPVQMSCEDNGIRMEVISTYIHENKAEIYISVRDIEQDRLDETVDLFDSYYINTPFDSSAYCCFVGYEPTTHTAELLITIEQFDEKNIVGDKLTFEIREMIAGKQTYEDIIKNVDLSTINKTVSTQFVYPRGYSMHNDNDNTYTYTDEFIEEFEVLKADKKIVSPTKGVDLMGIGYIDGKLHVQTYYHDIFNTDNHGNISLKNKKTGEIIECNLNVSFFDEEHKGSYDDIVFENIKESELADYELYGRFVTSSENIKGEWSVTFPLENTDDE